MRFTPEKLDQELLVRRGRCSTDHRITAASLRNRLRVRFALGFPCLSRKHYKEILIRVLKNGWRKCHFILCC